MGAPVGNQFAKKAKIWEQALKRALARYSGSTVEAGLDTLADKMVRAAAEGDESAWQVIEKIADRLDGKPAQAIVGGDEGDNPISVSVIAIKAVDP